MKFLHTSDWHLGVTMKGASCEEEQALFLDWLIETIQEKSIDVLIVAGDIFHRDQPPARVLQMYYRFLWRCGVDTGLRQVVIVGGNHDSPSRLDAPADVLRALKVHVVGGLVADEASWQRCLCPVFDSETGEVEAVIVAVPYVQEGKLGILTTSGNEMEVRDRYAERFRHLYSSLADQAEELYPGVPLIATGHLTCETEKAPVAKGDYHEEIHQVGLIRGLPPSIFDARYGYVALGHIHRMFPIEGRRVWYCGTPMPTSRTEVSTRYVMVVDTNEEKEGGFGIEALEVPIFRGVYLFEGTAEEICKQLEGLPKEADLVPYVFTDVALDSPDEVFEARARFAKVIDEAFDAGQRPRIVEPREHIRQVAREAGAEEVARALSLDELSPEEVFCQMYAGKNSGHSPSRDYLAAFRHLMATYAREDGADEEAPMLRGRVEEVPADMKHEGVEETAMGEETV